MELHWCATPGGNFGDDLNPLLWPGLFPDLATHREDARLYGVGTLLGARHDTATAKVVLGSGRGDASAPPVQGGWDFRWVRGPQTAHSMGLAANKALGDGAWLWDGLATPLHADGTVGLIPHCATWDNFDWTLVASLAGMRAINPKRSPSEVVDALRRCSLVVTESLHGAIFADAMGIPWAVCRLSYRFNEFKWRDWMQFVRRGFEPHDAVIPLAATLSRRKAMTNRLARWTDFRSQWRHNALRPVEVARLTDAWQVAEGLERFSRDASRFACSPAPFVARQQERMVEACAAFAKDYGLSFRAPGLRAGANGLATDGAAARATGGMATPAHVPAAARARARPGRVLHAA